MPAASVRAQACAFRRTLQTFVSTRAPLSTSSRRPFSSSPARRQRWATAPVQTDPIPSSLDVGETWADTQEPDQWPDLSEGHFPGQQLEPTSLADLIPDGQHPSITWTGPPPIEDGAPPTLTAWRLEQAVKANDKREVYAQLYALVSNPHRDEVITAMASIPRTTVTTIFLLLDPIEGGHELDPLHGLLADEHLQDYSVVGTGFDNLGVRRVHRFLFAAVESFASILLDMGTPLLTSEMVVLLRCAGATSDVTAVSRVWRMADNSATPRDQRRNSKMFEEFLGARFLIQPAYFQNDYNRLRPRPRSLTRSRSSHVLTPRQKAALERLRFRASLRKRFMYGAAPQDPTQELHWKVNLSHPLRRIWASAHMNGISFSEKLFAQSYMAIGRTAKIAWLRRSIQGQLGIKITGTRDHRLAEIVTDKEARHVPRYKRRAGAPTTRCPRSVEAILNAMASLGNVALARKIIDAVVVRDNMRFTRSFWSEFLAYAYVASAKSPRFEWKSFSHGWDNNHTVHPQDVLAIWDTMTSSPHDVQPTIEDQDKYVRALIHAGRFEDAIPEIRKGAEFYEHVVNGVTNSLLVRLYPSPPPNAHQDFLRNKATQHVTWYSIMRWCRTWIWEASNQQPLHGVGISERTIPDFVAEFSEFMASPVTYRTPTGLARLEDLGAVPKYQWKNQLVRSRPLSVLRRDGRPAYVDDEGVERKDRDGNLIFPKSHHIASHISDMTVRVRNLPQWEREGLEASCLKETADGNRTHVTLGPHAATCVHW